jgi:hemolysin activation/secretion protein
MPSIRLTGAGLLAGVALSIGTCDVAAQDVERGLRRDPARGPQQLEVPRPPDGAIDLRLTPLAPAPAGSLAAGADAIDCRELRLEGASVLDPVEVAAITRAWCGRTITLEELYAARDALTRLYVDRGWVASGVVIPEQDIADGVVRLRAVEGVLSAVELRNDPRFDARALLRGVDALRGRPLNLDDLRRELSFVDRSPLVDRVLAELRPGAIPGEAVLDVELVPARPWGVALTANNHRAPSVGAVQGVFEFSHLSLLGLSDRLSIYYAATEGLDDVGGDWRIPLFHSRWSLLVGGSRNDAAVIEEPFDRIDIESDAHRWTFGFDRRLLQSAAREAGVTLSIDNQRSRTFLLGLPFSFAPGVQDGRAEVTALRLSADSLWRGADHAVLLRARLSHGVDVFDPTRNDDLPDGRFTAIAASAQYARRLSDEGAQLIAALDLQYADRSLLPLEKYSLGGAWSVRGYRQNQVVRDNGWRASVEYRRPLAGRAGDAWGLSWGVFADAGRGWNADGYAPSPQDLSSLGVVLRWNPDPSWFGELAVAHGFQDFRAAERDLQDDGIHFALGWRFGAAAEGTP